MSFSRLVMVIEDEADVRDMIATLLENEGIPTMTAPDGKAGLQALRDAPALPKLVLLDLMMPRMSGDEFLSALRADPYLSAIPVVAISAARGPRLDYLRRLGVEEILLKPIDPSALLAATRQFVEREKSSPS
jgi:CheY-like chemotaxis protein